jgi:anti-sigma-K factor RskA
MELRFEGIGTRKHSLKFWGVALASNCAIAVASIDCACTFPFSLARRTTRDTSIEYGAIA